MTEQTAAEFWEARYADAGRVWSGNPNATVAAVAAELPAGRALELGCGEGADAIWLALRGWDVTGVDISPTALARGAWAADEAGVPAGRLRWVARDLSEWDGGDEEYDLVCSSFLHSPVALERTGILRRAADRVAPGGHLLIVTHADFPPWADREAHAHHRFLTPKEELDALDLPAGRWEVRLAETRRRDATSPAGEPATLDDGVVLLRRRQDT